MTRADVIGEGALELRNFRSSREPVGPEDCDDRFHIVILDALMAVGQQRGAHWCTAVDSELRVQAITRSSAMRQMSATDSH